MGAETFTVWYRSKGISLNATNLSDAYLIACLFPAMARGMNISSTEPVSPKLLAGISRIQDIFCKWYPELHKIKISAPTPPPHSSKANGTLSTFTGGVDSFYTLLKNKPAVNGLVNVHGFDVQLSDEHTYGTLLASLKKTSRHYKKRLTIVETNLREFSNKYCKWGDLYHGAALASVALLLSKRYGLLLLPSTHSYADLLPWGSHALVDHLWSTEYLDIVHDGAEATRFEKLQFISSSSFILDNLTVCWQSPDKKEGHRNCSKCEKCIRTMIALEALGKLESGTSFSYPLSPGAIKRINIRNTNDLAFLLENYEAVNKVGNEQLLGPLRIAIDNFKSKELYEHLSQNKSFFKSKYFLPLRPYVITTLWQTSTKLMLQKAPEEIVKKLQRRLKKKGW